MTKRELYSDHVDTLVALVQHLAMTEYKSRKPTALSTALSLDLDEVRLVLDGSMVFLGDQEKLMSKHKSITTLCNFVTLVAG